MTFPPSSSGFAERPPTWGAAVSQVRATLHRAGIDSAALDAKLLVAHGLGGMPADLIRDRDRPLAEDLWPVIAALMARRVRREPMAYILGEREFWSLPFSVTPATLIPRPDTETLVETALTLKDVRDRPLRILDLGTGCGCLLLSLLHEWPLAWGLGVDRSLAAVEVALANAMRLGLRERAAFVVADWTSAVRGPFDVIVANPPYIPAGDWRELAPEIRCFEPKTALVSGRDGLESYRRLLPSLMRLLTADGVAILEIGASQADGVVALAHHCGWPWAQVIEDLGGRPRCLALQATTTSDVATPQKKLGNQPLPD